MVIAEKARCRLLDCPKFRPGQGFDGVMARPERIAADSRILRIGSVEEGNQGVI